MGKEMRIIEDKIVIGSREFEEIVSSMYNVAYDYHFKAIRASFKRAARRAYHLNQNLVEGIGPYNGTISLKISKDKVVSMYVNRILRHQAYFPNLVESKPLVLKFGSTEFMDFFDRETPSIPSDKNRYINKQMENVVKQFTDFNQTYADYSKYALDVTIGRSPRKKMNRSWFENLFYRKKRVVIEVNGMVYADFYLNELEK